MRKPNSIIVLLYIFHIIHPQKQKRSVQPFCFWGEHSKGLSNQADVELDMINYCYTLPSLNKVLLTYLLTKWNICSRYCIYHVKFTSYCELIECSRPMRFFIVSLMYNNVYKLRRQLRQHHVLSTTTPDNCEKFAFVAFFDGFDTSCPIGKLPFSFLICGEFLKTNFLSMPQLSKYVPMRPNERFRKVLQS